MKHILALGLFLFFAIKSFAQTDGITYQAVIIGPDILELPGIDSEGNILPVTTVAIRFTIFDSGNQVEFQEVQITNTDEFGRINLIIGAVEHDDFEAISWDGTPKDLKVEIDFEGGSNFVDMSREILTFVPYAYHRNITATGTLDVDGDTFLNRELTVNGPTNLYSTLTVYEGNETNLSGDLTVDGATNLNSTLDVNNKSTTNLTGALNVGTASGTDDVDAPTVLNGTLNVVGKTTVTDFEATGQSTFNELTANTLEVITSSDLLGDTTMNGVVSIESDEQVKINVGLTAAGSGIDNHPVLIEGGTQGLAIRVSGGRNNNTNFITFFDTTRTESWGRIEGELPSEFGNNADYDFDQRSLDYDIADGVLDVAFATYDLVASFAEIGIASTSSTGCVGFGACVTGPIPSWIVGSIAQSVAAGIQLATTIVAAGVSINNKVVYDDNKITYQGVTYASGAGDYAEYLLREKASEHITYGDIVGVKGGKISKNTLDAEKIMVVSFKPIVLGAQPQYDNEHLYEKVAFMGQVPVKVIGKVNIGDYIIPCGLNNGMGIAINPASVSSKNINNILGVAWSEAEKRDHVDMVMVAVGLNINNTHLVVQSLENEVLKQASEINELRDKISEIFEKLDQFAPGSLKGKVLHKDAHDSDDEDSKHEVNQYLDDYTYYQITDEDIQKGIALAEVQMRDNGIDLENNEVWKKIKNDPSFKSNLIGNIKNQYSKQIHHHKKIDGVIKGN
ncbi:hypothetical protein GCM10023314_31750 [Algibacter agarivorans]|uniref:Peptidase G2 IMC autoproteolytic cleavage domain-containing protein n=1 Tax=Algibacter agarivorans TaxID=1109741 RepID=A0ABP9GZ47_9FLAO